MEFRLTGSCPVGGPNDFGNFIGGAASSVLGLLSQATRAGQVLNGDPAGLFQQNIFDKASSWVLAKTHADTHSLYFGIGEVEANLITFAAGGEAIDALRGAGIAARAAEDAGTAAGKEITTYYPPNRGFFDNPTSQVLKTGTQIDRYGGEGGTFVSPRGTPEAMRALPPGATTRPFNIYEVVNPFEVRAGTVSPWFGQLGLGTQYELPDSVGNLIQNGYLKLAEDGG